MRRVQEYPEPKGSERPGREKPATRERQRYQGTRGEDGDGAGPARAGPIRGARIRHQQVGDSAGDEECRALTDEKAEGEQDPTGEHEPRSPLAGGAPQEEASRDDREQREVLGVGGDSEDLWAEGERGEDRRGGDAYSRPGEARAEEIDAHRGGRGYQDEAGADAGWRLTECREDQSVDAVDAGQLAVVGQDHQRFQVDGILDVVGQQRLQRPGVLLALEVAPQQHRHEAVDFLHPRPLQPQSSLDPLEPARQPQAAQDVPQVDVRPRQPHPQAIPQDGHVERGSIECNQRAPGARPLDEVVQIA